MTAVDVAKKRRVDVIAEQLLQPLGQGAGQLTRHGELPSGHGVRTDTCGYVGYQTNPHFDCLLVKLIGHSTSPRFADAVARTVRALGELKIEGVRTNIPLLQRLLRHPDFVANRIDTRFLNSTLAGATVDPTDPLAVLAYGKGAKAVESRQSAVERGEWRAESAVYDTAGLEDCVVLHAPMQGTIVSIEVLEGDAVRQGQPLLVMNAMKMEHVIAAPASGVVRRVAVHEGDTVPEGHPLVFIEPRDVELSDAERAAQIDLDHMRLDLAEVQQRHAMTLDAARSEAVARRRKTDQRTARENIADLCDPGTFVEYGALQVAAQRQRRSMEDLIERTPADGLVAGIGRVNGHLFDAAKAQCVVLSYDYTVLAGTQGFQNHRKKDRMFELAARLRLPVVSPTVKAW